MRHQAAVQWLAVPVEYLNPAFEETQASKCFIIINNKFFHISSISHIVAALMMLTLCISRHDGVAVLEMDAYHSNLSMMFSAS